MKIIKQHSNILGECPTDLQDSYEWMERAGRVCYNSMDRISPGTAKPFINGLIKSGHMGVTEHSNFVVQMADGIHDEDKYINKLSNYTPSSVLYGANYRAWMEIYEYKSIEHLFYDFESETDIPNQLKRITVEIKTNRAITHQIVRHRPASFLQTSQRYVDQSNLEVILPVDFYGKENGIPFEAWKRFMESSEENYRIQMDYGRPKQASRGVLTNDTASTIIITADIPEWWWIFGLRVTASADPQIRDLMIPLKEEFTSRGWVL